MYLGAIKLEKSLTFYINTYTPATHAAVDADAVPGYRVYEDETTTPLLTGSMALLDDANTVGFYSEQIDVTAANGFEVNKSYCVRITSVVGGVTIAEVHQFDVITSVAGTPITDGISGSAVTKKRGDHWTVEFTGDNVIGDITGYTKLWLTAKRDFDDADSAAIFQIYLSSPADAVNDGLKYLNGVAATDAQRTKCAITVGDAATGAVTPTIDEAITAEFGEEFLVYDWQALIGGNPTTKKQGNWTITADVTRAIS